MSVNYTAPLSGAVVSAGLNNNPSISDGTISAIDTMFNIRPTTLLNVGNYTGGTLTAPSGPTNIVVVNQSGTTPFSIPSGTLNGAPVWIIDSNANFTGIWGEPLLSLSDTEGDSGLPTLSDGTGVDRIVSSGNGNDVLSFLDNHNTTVDGSAGNDSITTSGGADSITGGTGNDTISAGAGNDTIVSGMGADTVNGGTGFDVVQVGGTASSWTDVVANNTRVILTSTTNSANTVSATNVDFISFTGATGSQYSIVISGTTNEATTMRLYQGVFDRSADQGGAQYWQQQVREGYSPVAIANQFIASQEYVSNYGNQTNTQYVTQLYENTFNRAPDTAGLAYWLGALANGASKGGVAIAIVGSPEAVTSVDNVILVPGLI
jgi:Ca2+-binding RTX toxin-like protein